MILRAGCCKRKLIEFGLKKQNAGRLVTLLKHIQQKPEREFEQFLKAKNQYVYEMSKKW